MGLPSPARTALAEQIGAGQGGRGTASPHLVSPLLPTVLSLCQRKGHRHVGQSLAGCTSQGPVGSQGELSVVGAETVQVSLFPAEG